MLKPRWRYHREHEHDPERDAAAYLGGTMSARRKRSFDSHLIGCEDCWDEVRLGRRGRNLAESAREIAPQPLREAVRSSLEAAPVDRARRRTAIVTAAVMSALIAAPFALRGAGPAHSDVIAAIVSDFAAGPSSDRSPSGSVFPQTGGHLPQRAYTARLAGFDFEVDTYERPGGAQVSVYRAEGSLPMDHGPDGSRSVWTTERAGVAVACLDEPLQAVIVGRDLPQAVSVAKQVRSGYLRVSSSPHP